MTTSPIPTRIGFVGASLALRLGTVGASLAVLVGCSTDTKEKTAAMTAFVESCAVPVAGVLDLTSFNNRVTLTCAAFKPMTKGAPNGK